MMRHGAGVHSWAPVRRRRGELSFRSMSRSGRDNGYETCGRVERMNRTNVTGTGDGTSGGADTVRAGDSPGGGTGAVRGADSPGGPKRFLYTAADQEKFRGVRRM